MLRPFLFALFIGMSACSGPSVTTPPATVVQMPAQWAFLGTPTIQRVASATDSAFNARVDELPEDVLRIAVRGAMDQGWVEVSRSDRDGLSTVYFENERDMQLAISVERRTDTATALDATIASLSDD